MNPRPRLPLPLLALAIALVLPAGGGADAAPAREDPFVVRPFRPWIGGRWIGDAVCYGPHRDGQAPGVADPDRAQIEEDLRLIAGHWSLLRTYGAAGPAETALGVIRADSLGLRVLLGAWVAPDDSAANLRELETAIRLARACPDLVLGICVGNETQVSWSAHRSSQAGLIGLLREARAGSPVPVTTADDFAFWLDPASDAVAREVDFITMHAHPLWNGRTLEQALDWTRAMVDSVRARHPDRAVVLGETGWATSRIDRGDQGRLMKGAVGEAEQAAFFALAGAWSRESRVPLFFFEAFDENWKGGDDPDEVEKHWGLYRADRTPKAALADRP